MSQQINLFNPIFLKQKKYFSAVTMLQALGLILIGSLLLAAYLNLQLSTLQKESAATTIQLKAAQARLAELTSTYLPRKSDASLVAEIKKAEADLQSLRQVTAVLQKGEFGNTSGFAEYFAALSRQMVDGVWLTGFSVEGAGSEMSIQGRALRPELVPAYLTQLKKEPVMQGKSFATLEMRLPDQSAKLENGAEKPPMRADYLEFYVNSTVAGAEAVAPEAGKK